MAYELELSEDIRSRLGAFAALVGHGRDAFFAASEPGFRPTEGSEAKISEDQAQAPDWPGGPWPHAATVPMHEVGLLISLSAAGHLGEMRALLETGEVAYSLPLLARGVLENCGRLFAIYARPLVGVDPGISSPGPGHRKRIYAAAYLEVIGSAFAAEALARATLKLDPTSATLQDAMSEAEAERERLSGAFGPLFDPGSTDVSSAGKLKLEGVAMPTMTDLLNEVAQWMWPDPSHRPPPVYKVISGYAHSSLDAQRPLYRMSDTDTGRHVERRVPVEHIEYNVALAAIVFQRIFARLVGFYGWEEGPLHAYSEHLASVFPDLFSYG